VIEIVAHGSSAPIPDFQKLQRFDTKEQQAHDKVDENKNKTAETGETCRMRDVILLITCFVLFHGIDENGMFDG
jgi:hypothetical protein